MHVRIRERNQLLCRLLCGLLCRLFWLLCSCFINPWKNFPFGASTLNGRGPPKKEHLSARRQTKCQTQVPLTIGLLINFDKTLAHAGGAGLCPPTVSPAAAQTPCSRAPISPATKIMHVHWTRSLHLRQCTMTPALAAPAVPSTLA